MSEHPDPVTIDAVYQQILALQSAIVKAQACQEDSMDKLTLVTKELSNVSKELSEVAKTTMVNQSQIAAITKSSDASWELIREQKKKLDDLEAKLDNIKTSVIEKILGFFVNAGKIVVAILSGIVIGWLAKHGINIDLESLPK